MEGVDEKVDGIVASTELLSVCSISKENPTNERENSSVDESTSTTDESLESTADTILDYSEYNYSEFDFDEGDSHQNLDP